MKSNMRKYGNNRIINRLIVTGIAILTFFAGTILLAKILGEFVWLAPK